MKDRNARRHGFSLLGMGAVACVACCAGPLLAFLGGLSIAGLVSTLAIGAAGLVIAVVAGVAWIVVRHRSPSRTAGPSEPVPVAGPTRKQ